MKKILCAVLICLFVVGCLPEGKSGAPDAVRVEIAERTFKLPKGYFDGRPPYGRDTESVVLRYSLPGFEVLPVHPQYRAERQQLIDAGRMRGMLLENAAVRSPLGQMASNLMGGLKVFTKEQDDFYGLEKYTAPKPEGAYALKPDDMFLERDESGIVQSFLMCSPPDKVKIPACRHTFIDKGLLYRISWHISELPNWKSQRDDAVNFIDSFDIHLNVTGE